MSEVPTLSAWSTRQRYLLGEASRGTRSQRSRSAEDHTRVVLAAILSKIGPAAWRAGDLPRHTGLTPGQAHAAIVALEAAGHLEPGSAKTGRLGILVPDVLAALGLGGVGLGLAEVRPDVPPMLPDVLSAAALAGASW